MIVRCSKCQDFLYDDGDEIPTLMLACPNCSAAPSPGTLHGELREALQKISSGMGRDMLGTTSLSREDMQSIAQALLASHPAPAPATRVSPSEEALAIIEATEQTRRTREAVYAIIDSITNPMELTRPVRESITDRIMALIDGGGLRGAIEEALKFCDVDQIADAEDVLQDALETVPKYPVELRCAELEGVLIELTNACAQLPATDGRVIGLIPIITRARDALASSSRAADEQRREWAHNTPPPAEPGLREAPVQTVARALARAYWKGRGETITQEQEDEFWLSWGHDAEEALTRYAVIEHEAALGEAQVEHAARTPPQKPPRVIEDRSHEITFTDDDDEPPQKQAWISVKDRLPEKERYGCLLYCAETEIEYVGYRIADKFYIGGLDVPDHVPMPWADVTHWMPLPAGPVEKQGEHLPYGKGSDAATKDTPYIEPQEQGGDLIDCPLCAGTGEHGGPVGSKCPKCHGKAQIAPPDQYMCRGCGKEMDPAYEAVWSGGTARHWDVKAQAWCGPVEQGDAP